MNEFLISVCDAIVRDREADQIMIYAKTEMESTMSQEVASQEIAGGFENKLLFDHNHTKRLNFTLNDARFDEGYLAINSGVLIENVAKDVYKRDIITLDASGNGVASSTPVGKVFIKGSTGIVSVTPSGSNFTYLQFASQKVEVVYKYNTNVDSIDFNASKFSKTYELTLIGKRFNKTGQSAEIQIIIPNWKPTGSFSLNFTAEGNTTSPIEGKALADDITDSYGSLNIVPVNQTITYSAIASIPTNAALSSSNSTVQITTYGIRGGSYANVLFDASACTYVSSTTATATVNSSGLVTRAASGTTTITITHTSGLKDYVQITAS
jgi:hypothetical protein